MKDLVLPPSQRRVALRSVKITGRTLRFKGPLDLTAAELFYAIPEEQRGRVKFINMTDVWRVHASGLLPILADFLGRQQRVELRVIQNPWVNRYLSLYGYGAALGTATVAVPHIPQCVHNFREDGPPVFDYVNSASDVVMRRSPVCGNDVARGLEWTINELIGNVFHHAESPIGALVQFLVQPQQRRAFLTIADTGRGLRDVLSDKYSVDSDEAAIHLAIQRGVTSKRTNQGWGLFGSTQIAEKSGGAFTIWTGEAALYIRNGQRIDAKMPRLGGTLLEWMIPTNGDFNLRDALQVPNEPVAVTLEKYEPELGVVHFPLASEAQSFGNRATGKQLRLKLVALMDAIHANRAVIDFAGVRLVASSFADELVAKLIYVKGKKSIALVNIDELNRGIVDAAIEQRLKSESEADVPQRIDL